MNSSYSTIGLLRSLERLWRRFLHTSSARRLKSPSKKARYGKVMNECKFWSPKQFFIDDS